MPQALAIPPGGKVNRWTILSVDLTSGVRRWRCVCECGRERLLEPRLVVSGHSKSCGCLSVEMAAARRHAAARPAEERFWGNVDRSGDCWLWTGGKDKDGYGKFRVSTSGPGAQTRAHRFSYELHHGPLADGLMVCHSCDNPPCVRPEHLFPGTALQNRNDAVAKGRLDIRGDRNPNSNARRKEAR